MTDTSKKIEELSINQAMGQLYKSINALPDKGDNISIEAKINNSFHVLERALTKAQEDNYSKIKEIANILQEPVIKDFKQYNSKY